MSDAEPKPETGNPYTRASHEIAVAARVRKSEDFEPFLWGRNRYARLGVVRVHGFPATSVAGPHVTIEGYSAGQPDGPSPAHLSYIPPAIARAIGQALIEAADAAEGATHER